MRRHPVLTVEDVRFAPLSDSEWRVSDRRHTQHDIEALLGFVARKDDGFVVTRVHHLRGSIRLGPLDDVADFFAAVGVARREDADPLTRLAGWSDPSRAGRSALSPGVGFGRGAPVVGSLHSRHRGVRTGGIVSIITERVSVFDFEIDGDVDERNANRLNGMLVAVSASILLWGGIGAGIWGVVSLFG